VALALANTLLPWLTSSALAVTPLHGSVRYETLAYTDSESRGSGWENFFELLVRNEGTLAGSLTYQVEMRAVADDAEFTAGAFSIRNEDRRRPYLSLMNLSLDWRPLSGLRLSTGQLLVNWSGFDEVEPANLMRPSDESDIFRRVPQGVYGIAARYERSDVYVELTVVPLAFRPSRLPQGRWNIVPTTLQEEQDLPPVRLNETQAGLRVGARREQLDLALVGYVGRDFNAMFVPTVAFVGGNEVLRVTIHQQYPRLNAGGLVASYRLSDDLLLKAESVYFNSSDRARDDFLQSAVGFDVAVSDWYLAMHYMRDDQTLRAPLRVTNKGERRFFQSFLYGEARYDPSDSIVGRVRGGYDFTGEFLVVQPEVSYLLWQRLRLALLADIVDGKQRSYFRAVRNEDRIGTRIEYLF